MSYPTEECNFVRGQKVIVGNYMAGYAQGYIGTITNLYVGSSVVYGMYRWYAILDSELVGINQKQLKPYTTNILPNSLFEL